MLTLGLNIILSIVFRPTVSIFVKVRLGCFSHGTLHPLIPYPPPPTPGIFMPRFVPNLQFFLGYWKKLSHFGFNFDMYINFQGLVSAVFVICFVHADELLGTGHVATPPRCFLVASSYAIVSYFWLEGSTSNLKLVVFSFLCHSRLLLQKNRQTLLSRASGFLSFITSLVSMAWLAIVCHIFFPLTLQCDNL